MHSPLLGLAHVARTTQREPTEDSVLEALLEMDLKTRYSIYHHNYLNLIASDMDISMMDIMELRFSAMKYAAHTIMTS